MGLPSGQTSGLDFTSFDNALKLIYSKQAVVDETYKNRPFHAIVPKATDFPGRAFVQDVLTSYPQGRSRGFSNAQANKSGAQIDQFTVPRAYDFALASVDIWTMYASEDDRGALLDALTTAINGARGSLMRSATIAEFRDGTGLLGRVGAVTTGASGTITLTDPKDIVNFEKNMALNAYGSSNATYSSTTWVAGTATRHTTAGNTVTAPDGSTSAGVMIVQSVDRINGILTLDNVPTNVATTNGGDFLCADGDYSTQTVAGVTCFGKITGLAGWIPYGGPSSTDSFMGLNRSGDNARLAGWSSNQIGKAEDEALLNASYEAFMFNGAAPTHAFVSPNRFNNIAKLLGPQKRYTEVKATTGSIGFQALEVQGQGSMLKVLADPNCPDSRGYLLTMEDIKLMTLGAMPRFLNPNNRTLLEATANRVEIRVGYAGNIVCKAPAHQCVLAFAA